MTGWVVFFSLITCMLVQSMMPSMSYLGESKPPCLLGAVVYFALMREQGVALLVASLAGIIQDSLGHGPIGISIWCFVVIAWFISNSREKLFHKRTSTHMLLGVIGSTIMITFTYLFFVIDGTLWLPLSGMLAKLYGTILLALITIPLTFRAIEQVDRWVGFAKITE